MKIKIKGEIQVLNVKDGDAILIHLNKDSEDLVMVVDGGHKGYYEKTIKKKLSVLLKKLNKEAPDIIVVTHYDADHIGGLIPLAMEYGDKIKEVWVHKPPAISEREISIHESLSTLKGLKSINQFSFFNKILESDATITESEINEMSLFVVDSLRKLREFLAKIPDNKIRRVFDGYTYKNWPEIQVLGPTEDYYDSLFPPNFSIEDLIMDEIRVLKQEQLLLETTRMKNLMDIKVDSCSKLKTDESVHLTKVNCASIVFKIDNNNKRYLFTGDAGLHSFKEIPNWKKELANLYWLKIPHHGSDNNMSKEMISIMKPTYAVSTGGRHQDEHVIECIRNKSFVKEVKTTKESGDIKYKI